MTMTIDNTNQPGWTECAVCGMRERLLVAGGETVTVTCPDGETDGRKCEGVLAQLSANRAMAVATARDLHPRNLAILEKSGLTLADLDAEIARQQRKVEADRELRYGPPPYDVATALGTKLRDWIGGDKDRALLVVRAALGAIDISAGGTRTMLEIGLEADRIGRAVGEMAAELADQDWETEGDGE